jgi:hypothetical protein
VRPLAHFRRRCQETLAAWSTPKPTRPHVFARSPAFFS